VKFIGEPSLWIFLKIKNSAKCSLVENSGLT
jgi:hypothetical protein